MHKNYSQFIAKRVKFYVKRYETDLTQKLISKIKMNSKIQNCLLLLTILISIVVQVIYCGESRKERFTLNTLKNDGKGTPIQKGFKAGYFGVQKAEDKRAYAAAAARCAGEPTNRKTDKGWEAEDDDSYKISGQACHKAGRDWGEDAKQGFVAGASVGSTNSLIKGLNKINLKEVKPDGNQIVTLII